jgi:hypothetical protein
MTGARSELNQKRRMGLAAEELLRFVSERRCPLRVEGAQGGELGTHIGGQQLELEAGGDPCGADAGLLSRLLGTHCRDLLLCLLRPASLSGALS